MDYSASLQDLKQSFAGVASMQDSKFYGDESSPKMRTPKSFDNLNREEAENEILLTKTLKVKSDFEKFSKMCQFLQKMSYFDRVQRLSLDSVNLTDLPLSLPQFVSLKVS